MDTASKMINGYKVLIKKKLDGVYAVFVMSDVGWTPGQEIVGPGEMVVGTIDDAIAHAERMATSMPFNPRMNN